MVYGIQTNGVFIAIVVNVKPGLKISLGGRLTNNITLITSRRLARFVNTIQVSINVEVVYSRPMNETFPSIHSYQCHNLLSGYTMYHISTTYYNFEAQ